MKRILLGIVLMLVVCVSKPEPQGGITLEGQPNTATCLRYGVCPTDVR